MTVKMNRPASYKSMAIAAALRKFDDLIVSDDPEETAHCLNVLERWVVCHEEMFSPRVDHHVNAIIIVAHLLTIDSSIRFDPSVIYESPYHAIRMANSYSFRSFVDREHQFSQIISSYINDHALPANMVKVTLGKMHYDDLNGFLIPLKLE